MSPVLSRGLGRLLLATVKLRYLGRSRRRPPHLASGAPKDPWGRFWAGLGVLVLVIGIGTIGYVQFGLTFGDALYQTVITITTVGYHEVGTVTLGYRNFTILVILLGTATALYTLGVLIESLFEGRLDDQIRRRRMQKQIDRMSDHVVLCGFGQVGDSIYRALASAGKEVVVVDRRDVSGEMSSPSLVGEATDDSILVAAGLERAGALVLALDSDVDNLFVALTARSMCPELLIVARSNESSSEPKLRQAGVDRVVNAHAIGGSRMAALVLQPDVVEYLDVVMHDERLEVRLSEIQVSADSPFANLTLSSCRIRESTGATVLAVRRDGSFVIDPPGHFELAGNDVMIALGTKGQIAQLMTRAAT